MKRYAFLILTILLLAPMLPLMNDKSELLSQQIIQNTGQNTSTANILNFSEVEFDLGRDASMLMLVDWWQSPHNRSSILLFETGDSPSFSSFSNVFTTLGDFIIIKVGENGTVYQEQILQSNTVSPNYNKMQRYSRGGFESLTVVDEDTIFLSGTFYIDPGTRGTTVNQRLYDVNYSTSDNRAAILIAKLNRTSLALEDSKVYPSTHIGDYPCRIEAYPSTKTDGKNVTMRFAMYRPEYTNVNHGCNGIGIESAAVGSTRSPSYQYFPIYTRQFAVTFEKDLTNITAYDLPLFKSVEDEYGIDFNSVTTYSGLFGDQNGDVNIIIGNSTGYIVLNHTECDQYGGVSWVSENYTAITCTREITAPVNPVLDVEHILLVIDIANQTLTEHSLGIRTNDEPSTIHQLFGDNILLHISCGSASPCREFGLAETTP